MARKSYWEKLKDPRWQKKRLEVLEAAGWKCNVCMDDSETLHVHHGCYQKGKEPWEAENSTLHVLCESCHGDAQEGMELAKYLLGHLPPDFVWSVCGYIAAFGSHDPSPLLGIPEDSPRRLSVSVGVVDYLASHSFAPPMLPAEVAAHIKNERFDFDAIRKAWNAKLDELESKSGE